MRGTEPLHSYSQIDSRMSAVGCCPDYIYTVLLNLCLDPQAEEKALWVQAKRGVLAILRVQPAQDLVESLMRPVTDDEEEMWEHVLEAEIETEQARQVPRRQRSEAAGDSAYRLEDIRS